MQIKTSDGDKSVGSAGMTGAALGLAIPGTRGWQDDAGIVGRKISTARSSHSGKSIPPC